MYPRSQVGVIGMGRPGRVYLSGDYWAHWKSGWAPQEIRLD